MIAARHTTIERTPARPAGGAYRRAPVVVDAAAEVAPGLPPSARNDAIAPLLARAVQERDAGDPWTAPLSRPVLQRFVVDPLPKMKHQYRRGVLGIVDLNCGWYCMVAAMTHHLGRPLGLTEAKRRLPKSTWLAYSPQLAGNLANSIGKPSTLAGWESRLRTFGPIVVAGKLGAADWGFLGGVGHFVLIVGADPRQGTLTYMDPLIGNKVCRGRYAHMEPRINDDDVYTINTQELEALFPEDFAPEQWPVQQEPEQPEPDPEDVVFVPPVESRPPDRPPPDIPTQPPNRPPPEIPTL